jgi:hypothetical protein
MDRIRVRVKETFEEHAKLVHDGGQKMLQSIIHPWHASISWKKLNLSCVDSIMGE